MPRTCAHVAVQWMAAPDTTVEVNGEPAPDGIWRATLEGDEASFEIRAQRGKQEPVVYTLHVTRESGEWTEEYLKTEAPVAGDRFGGSLALRRNTLVVGSPDSDKYRGSAYIYSFVSSAWQLDAIKHPPDTIEAKPAEVDTHHNFGRSVAVDEAGQRVLIGSNQQDAYLFVHNGMSWEQVAVIRTGGHAVAIDGDTIAASVPWGKEEASVRIHERASDGSWQEAMRIVGALGTAFGGALALHRNTLVVGEEAAEQGGSADAGAAHVYHKRDGRWSDHGEALQHPPHGYDYFGMAVAIDPDYIVVGAPGRDSARPPEGFAGHNNGAVLIYDRHTLALLKEIELREAEQPEANCFGRSVDLADGRLLVGATDYDGSLATSADCHHHGGTGRGFLYYSVEDAIAGAEPVALAPAGLESGDLAGYRIAASGPHVAVSAPREDGAGQGFGGERSDNSAEDSGTVYLFR